MEDVGVWEGLLAWIEKKVGSAVRTATRFGVSHQDGPHSGPYRFANKARRQLFLSAERNGHTQMKKAQSVILKGFPFASIR